MIRIPALLPEEHVYSCFVRGRFLSAQMHLSDKEFFSMNQLPYHWLRSQVPLCGNMNAVLELMSVSLEQQFKLRLLHTPFAPWLLSLPNDLKPSDLTESNVRNNMEESPFNVDKRWKFCPHCLAEDRTTFGVSYWRSFHQLPGVLICEKHKVALHSHAELRYLAFKLPHHFLNGSEELVVDADWQHRWQPFIYKLSRHLQANPEWGRDVPNYIKRQLQIEGVIKSTHRPLFNNLFKSMREDVGMACLAGLFTRFARNNGRMPNILWLTLSGRSQNKGIRHPLYWLAILFWLRDELPELRFLREDR